MQDFSKKLERGIQPPWYLFKNVMLDEFKGDKDRNEFSKYYGMKERSGCILHSLEKINAYDSPLQTGKIF